jgi:hypothetical protein
MGPPLPRLTFHRCHYHLRIHHTVQPLLKLELEALSIVKTSRSNLKLFFWDSFRKELISGSDEIKNRFNRSSCVEIRDVFVLWCSLNCFRSLFLASCASSDNWPIGNRAKLIIVDP